jgi:hypothetical protein
MAIDFNTEPYYDDYSESDQFYRILFKPGRAVQARELTQLQTILQKQIERFGKHVFKEGSIVLPGTKHLDTKYRFVKLTSAEYLDSTIIGKEIIGQTTGVTAVIENFKLAEGSDPPTIFVKYRTSGTGSTGTVTAFQDGEELRNSDSSVILTAVSTGATGTGVAFNISAGVIFVRGHFVYFDSQTLILEKYAQVSNLIVGFDIAEELISSDDNDILLDPALSSTNYLAPGADRYKISLTLSTREFTPNASDDPDFVELLRIESGLIIQSLDVQYNLLADTLARRTYDESGDYVVTPFRMEVLEHLRTTNVQSSLAVVRDGVYEANANGNASLFVGVVSQGKAYVKGYEIDSLTSRYVNFEKARDSVAITNGSISTPIGNYIEITGLYGAPDITNMATVSLYNNYTAAAGTASGTRVGAARVRGMEYGSGTIGSSSSVYRLYLFDVTMEPGYSFEYDVKQVYYDNPSTPDFTANVVPTLVELTGTVTTVTGNTAVVGTGTRFQEELTAGDYITASSQILRVSAVTGNTTITLSSNATANVSGIIPSIHTATITDATNSVYVFPLPYTVIKSVDPANTETTYKTRRSYARSLVAGATTLTAGTGETFPSYSADNYQLVVTSGGNSGQYVSLSGNITIGGGGSTATISLSGYSTESVYVIATVNKSISAADRKIKTLVTNQTVDFTTQAAATASVLSLGAADVYALTSVRMSSNAFGTAYSTTNEVDITSRYTFDTGQRSTHYDVGRVTLKPGQPKPTGPVRVTYNYFTHGAGDYFSVESYDDVGYENIPSFTSGSITYNLRDCLDFRPRINNAGTGFTGSGAVLNEFIDHEDGLITDYEYYLPRIDKLVLDTTGRLRAVKGVSSLTPKEPPTPDDSMPLYVLTQKAYVFDAKKEVEIKSIDNRRYTMRDIGKIENRVKNLEYYTQLSLLERDTEQFQIKDAQGFDRFKNGFVVDPFRGHGIGDPFNSDYAVAVDAEKQIARPLSSPKNFRLAETATTTGQRTSNSYVLVGDIITLPYTEEVAIENSKASVEVNLNPYNIVNYVGVLTLNPAVDNWFDTVKLPDVYRNEDGNYDSVVADAIAKGTWGTVWGAWKKVGKPKYSVNASGQTIKKVVKKKTGTQYTVVEVIDTQKHDDVVQSTTLIPKMRDIDIAFIGEGLKPNTRVYVYFDEIDVTNYCRSNVNLTGNVQLALNTVAQNSANLITSSTGRVDGYFSYRADTFDLNNGIKTMRLVDSSFNGIDFETAAEAVFTSSGELQNVADEIVSTRNARIDTTTVTKKKTVKTVVDTLGTPSSGGAQPSKDFLDMIYNYAFGRDPDPAGKAYWLQIAAQRGISTSTIQNMTVGVSISAQGHIDPSTVTSYNDNAIKVYELVKDIAYVGIAANNENGGLIATSSLISEWSGSVSKEQAAVNAAIQITAGVANKDAGSFNWTSDAQQAYSNGLG